MKVNRSSILSMSIFIVVIGFFIEKFNLISLPYLNYIDEIILVFFIIYLVIFCFENNVKIWFLSFLALFFSYSIYLIVKNDLPLVNVFQSFLTIKYIFVFYFFYSLSDFVKYKIFIKVYYFSLIILFLSVPFAIFDFILPNFFFDLAKDSRGINGVSVGSIFGSRVLFSEFLLVVAALLFSLKKIETSHIIFSEKMKIFYLFLITILLFLTYSRKELLLFLVFFTAYFFSKTKKSQRLPAFFIAGLLFGGFFVIFWVQFKTNIQANLNEGYVRYKIFYHAMDIFNYYSPFGSGPGTYGSMMSKSYTLIYEKFEVSRSIIGWGKEVDGPIFDLFFVSMFAEYGVGIFLFFAVIIKIYRMEINYFIKGYFKLNLLRSFLLIEIFSVGFFVPILGNVVGFVIFSILGLLTANSKRKKFDNI